jgi:hypothetical protein
MRPGSTLFSILFVVYCLEMGIFLLLWPWSASWDRAWSQLPWYDARHYGLSPLLRSVVSGFGVVHLVWGAHDFELWLRRLRRQD